MSAENIVINGRELTAFDLPPEPTDEYKVHVDGLGEVVVQKGKQPSDEDVPAKYVRKMIAGLCEQNAKLYRENAELRELLRVAITYCVNGYCGKDDGCPLRLTDYDCQLLTKASKLGVEVDG